MKLDPYSILLEAAKSNPQARDIIEKMQKGENPENIYREMCKQKGINPDEFIKRFR